MNRLPTFDRFPRFILPTLAVAGIALTAVGCSRPTDEQIDNANCRSELAREMSESNQGLTPDPSMVAQMCAEIIARQTVSVTAS